MVFGKEFGWRVTDLVFQIGKVTKKGLTDFEVTDHEGNLMYQIRGPGLALKFGCGGKKKFFANIQGPNGQKVSL